MTRIDPLTRLLQDLRADLIDYGRLKELLEIQFDAALKHQSSRLGEVAADITALVDTLDGRRQERVALAGVLLGSGREVCMAEVFKLLPAPRRPVAQSGWEALEKLVRECKALNERNCRLLMDQHEIMQRVLNREMDTYAPA